MFDSQRYTEFVATCDIEDPKRRVSAVSRFVYDSVPLHIVFGS